MTDITEIKSFLLAVANAISKLLNISVIIVNRQGEDVFKMLPENIAVHNGIVNRVIKEKKPLMTDSPGNEPECKVCRFRGNCAEKAYMHCPIMYEGECVGVIGLICYNEQQRKMLKEKKDYIFVVIQSMGELIALKLSENHVYKKLEKNHEMLNQIINSISEGCIILDNQNNIKYINTHALQIIGISNRRSAVGFNVEKVIPDETISDMLRNKKYNIYEELHLGKKNTGVILSPILGSNEEAGVAINFKTVEAISPKLYGKAMGAEGISFEGILGDSVEMTRVKDMVRLVSKSNASVLLFGESGTGKELFARAIHQTSPRSNCPFVAINCAAIPADLLESELFGYEKGAFTGASKMGKIGKFELADTGTIFLDEIGDMPIHLQAKILRVLQERTVDRIGGTQQKKIDIRIIAATNKNLEKMVKENEFREDLYYRLSVIPVHIPPLRQRKGDITILTNYFIEKYSASLAGCDMSISKSAMDKLSRYTWPGNVRELENIVQYLISINVDKPDGVIDEDSIPERLVNVNGAMEAPVEDQPIYKVKELEKREIEKAINRFGNSSEGKYLAAKALGISVPTLYRKLAAYQVNSQA